MIEVLTAIVVALIGLAGVLVMIPFAINQAEVGMDTEKSVNLARNAAAELEIRGTLESSPPVITNPVVPGTFRTIPNATVRSYCLDPAGVAARATAGTTTGTFPFLRAGTVAALETMVGTLGQQGGGYDQMFLVQRASVGDPSSTPILTLPLRQSLARNQFTWGEDFQTRAVTDQEFADPVLNPPGVFPSKDLVLPIQQFDQTVTSTGTVLNGRRQSLGEMSWLVIATPSVFSPALAATAVDGGGATPGYPATAPLNQLEGAQDIVSEMQTFYISFKRRPLPVEVVGNALQPYDRVYQVDWPGVTVTATALVTNDNSFRYSYNGGMMKLREECRGGAPRIPNIPAEIKQSNDESSQRAEIRRGDWIGLTNVHYDRSRGRFIQTWNFYRVTEAALSTDFLGLHWAVMLEGPEWDFGRQYRFDTTVPSQVFDPTFTAGSPPTWGPPDFRFGMAQITGSGSPVDYYPSSTMAVHLPDAWTVFERTARLGSQ